MIPSRSKAEALAAIGNAGDGEALRQARRVAPAIDDDTLAKDEALVRIVKALVATNELEDAETALEAIGILRIKPSAVKTIAAGVAATKKRCCAAAE